MSFRPFLFVATIVVAFLVMMGESKSAEYTKHTKYIKYTTVTGYFQQDDPDTVSETFDYVSSFLASPEIGLTPYRQPITSA